MYATRVNDIDELRTWISEELATIPVQHLQNAVGYFEKQLQTVIDIGGLQVEVLKKFVWTRSISKIFQKTVSNNCQT